MNAHVTRRQLLTAAAGAAGACLTPAAARADAPGAASAPRFRYCLNMSTIRGQKLPVDRQVAVAAEAGYDAVEPWLGEVNAWVEQGNSLRDLRKRIEDAGLTVESGIAFGAWIVDDDAARAKGLEQCKRDMDVLAQIGGTRIAAPPAGATDKSDLDLFRAAERYARLLELGDEMGVVPQVEVWGFSKSLSRLGETVLVAVESGHPKACVLPDVYHIHKGGSDFDGLKQLGPLAVQVFHMNDYPADPPRETINDSHRVYPGDGVAPLDDILRTLRDIGFQGTLSLELFNPDYWKQDALVVAKTGLAKMKAAVEKALG